MNLELPVGMALAFRKKKGGRGFESEQNVQKITRDEMRREGESEAEYTKDNEGGDEG